MDLTIALAASSSLTGATVFKSLLNGKPLTVLLTISAVLAVVKPILKLSNGIDRCSKLRYGYLELYQKVEILVNDIRDKGNLTDTSGRINALTATFNKLSLRGSPKKTERIC